MILGLQQLNRCCVCCIAFCDVEIEAQQAIHSKQKKRAVDRQLNIFQEHMMKLEVCHNATHF